MKQLFLITALLFFGLFSHAQLFNPDIKAMEKAKSRKLLVVTDTFQKEVITYIKEQGQEEMVEEYKATVVSVNDALRKWVPELWKHNQDIEFIQYKAFIKMRDANKNLEDYAYMIVMIRNDFGVKEDRDFPGIGTAYQIQAKSKGKSTKSKHFNGVLHFDLMENKQKTSKIYDAPLINGIPGESDIVFGIMNTNFVIKYEEKGNKSYELNKYVKEHTKLHKKTLLVDKGSVKDDVDKAAIKEVYTGKFKLVEKAVFDEAIINRDTAYAVAVVIKFRNQGQTLEYKVVVNCSNGQLYALDNKEAMTKSMVNATGFLTGLLTKSNFKEFNNYID